MRISKEILREYLDACDQVEETKNDLIKLQKERKQLEQDVVKGSSHEFPYTMQTYHLEGISYSLVQDLEMEERLENVLQERLKNAEKIKFEVEAWLNTIPTRMQRIIRYRIFEELPWTEVAVRIGRKATPDGIRKEYERFMGAT